MVLSWINGKNITVVAEELHGPSSECKIIEEVF